MYKIAAMGDKDSIAGFAALGIHVFPADEAQAARELLRKLPDSGYAVIFITEELAELIYDEIDKFKETLVPSVILIPGLSGGTGRGLESVSAMVEKAVGIDIFK